MDKPKIDTDTARALAVAGELRLLIGKLKRRLRQEGNMDDLTASQIAVLAHLDREGPSTVTSLARAEGVRSQSMGATVSTLETAGLVSGAPDPGDGRQTILSLTPTCQEMIRAGRAAREDWLFRAIQTRLVPTEQEQLANAIELLKRILDL